LNLISQRIIQSNLDTQKQNASRKDECLRPGGGQDGDTNDLQKRRNG